jgi:hypothetical protein
VFNCADLPVVYEEPIDEVALLNLKTGSVRRWSAKDAFPYISRLWQILSTDEEGFVEEQYLSRIINSVDQCTAFLDTNLWNTQKLLTRMNQ